MTMIQAVRLLILLVSFVDAFVTRGSAVIDTPRDDLYHVKSGLNERMNE